MDVTDFLLPRPRPADFRAMMWLKWAGDMRRRIDAKRAREEPFIRAWRETVDGSIERRNILLAGGERDMDALLALLDFLHARLDWLEARAFAALGLFDGEPAKPDRPESIKDVTADEAARLMGDEKDDTWRLLFAGRAAQTRRL